jgi:SAM-dependent methyltransferase
MSLLERIHGGYAYGRRVEQLSRHLADVLPHAASVLDVGCGDGLVAQLVNQKRPDLLFTGIDVLVRPQTHIPVKQFDGSIVPYEDATFDAVMFVDVLHHTEDPLVLLREAARVSRSCIVLKDHTANGILANETLRFMDSVGNARHGVVLPYNYWTLQQWHQAFEALDLSVSSWKKDLALYPVPANWIFGRSLHFVARLGVKTQSSTVCL